jgi:hypothetical protein
MADLLDIAPSTSVGEVRIGGGRDVTIRALHANDIAAIVTRFPDVVAVMAVANRDLVALMSSIGPAVGMIIAAGCDHPGDEAAERIANSFQLEDQIRLFKAIMGLTFPNGLASFMETMAVLMTGGEADEAQKLPDDRLRKSPSPSPLSSDAGSRQPIQ